MYKEISYKELLILRNRRNYVIVDIRSKYEYNRKHINGAISMPEHEILNKLDKFNKNNIYIFVCSSGRNSSDVARTLSNYGYNTISLVNGMRSVK